MREPPRLFVNLLVCLICCVCVLVIFILAELHQYAISISIIALVVLLVLIIALATVLIMRDLNKQEIERTESRNEQGLRQKRVRYREELPLDAYGVPLYLPADAQPNPQQYRRHEEPPYRYRPAQSDYTQGQKIYREGDYGDSGE